MLDEDITQLELKADGSWRPKLEGNARNGEPWRPSPMIGTKRLVGDERSSSATDSNFKGNEDEHSVNQDPSEKNAISLDENDDVEISSQPRDAPSSMWQTRADDAANGEFVIVLSSSDDEGLEEEAVVGYSGVSMYAESDVGNGEMRSPEVSRPDDTNGDSSGLGLGLESANAKLASNSASLPFVPLPSTRVGISVSDEGTSNNSGLGLRLDSNGSWAPPENASNGNYRYYGSQTEAVVSQLPPLVRPTPVQAGAGSGFLSTSLIRDDTLQSGWKSYSRPLTSVLYGATDGASMDCETTSPLQNFLPARPARAEVLS